MTYPPSGSDPHGQQPSDAQPPSYDPYAAPQPPTYSDPTAPPPVSPAAPSYPDPYAAQQPPASAYDPSVPPLAPYGQQPDPYAQQAPYGQPAAPYAYGPTGAPGKTNGMAIGALCTGIASILFACCCAGLGIVAGGVGVTLGIIARKQIKERNESGDGMALAGLITGAVGAALSVLSFIVGLIWKVNGTDWLNNF